MTKKVLMIALYLVLGYQAKAVSVEANMMTRHPASERLVAAKAPKKMQNICMIQAGDVGKLKFKGQTYEQAFSRVTDECFKRRTNLFVQARNMQPDQDRQIQFAESCVNSIKCI